MCGELPRRFSCAASLVQIFYLKLRHCKWTFCEVANGGIKYKPYVVKAALIIKMATLKEIFGPDKLGIPPVPKNIMDLIREGLRDVTNEGG